MPDQEKKLSEREELILNAIVQCYITTAEPVGSRTIVKRFSLPMSAATVRNVMADLEDDGYLQQLHTSSGRVPTDRGYRYYVNYLMQVQALTQEERDRMEEDFNHGLGDADQLLQRTSRMLAMVSHHAGIVEVPNEARAVVGRIDLMPMGNHRVVVLIADTIGRVHTMVVEQSMTLDDARLERVTRFLNQQLRGVAIDELAGKMSKKVQEFLDEQRQLAEDAVSILGLLPQPKSGQLLLEGASHLFEQPEFHNMEKAREVFHLFEERDQLIHLLRSSLIDGDPGAHIMIGSESAREGLGEISVISAPYRVKGETAGTIGVLGPRRMPYSKITALVDHTANMLGRLLTRIAG